ncbi:hypothetical protein B0H19DRAFT_1233391 [Mycena capillaripes]|nr:hypothetical protein B0H19DRAFT_1233391 [Mycena capillaripes]
MTQVMFPLTPLAEISRRCLCVRSVRPMHHTSTPNSTTAQRRGPLMYDDPYAYFNPGVLVRYQAIYKNWHRAAPVLPKPWSCDWRYWAWGRDVPSFSEEWSEMYGIAQGIEPLAFLPRMPEPMFVFAAGDKYYSYDQGSLLHFNAEFASHDEFLERFDGELRNVTELRYLWVEALDKRSSTSVLWDSE